MSKWGKWLLENCTVSGTKLEIDLQALRFDRAPVWDRRSILDTAFNLGIRVLV